MNNELETRLNLMLDNPVRKAVTLFYVDRDDRLTDDQIELFLDGSDESFAELIDQISEVELDWFYCNLNLDCYDDDLEQVFPGFWDLKRDLEEADEWNMATELWERGCDMLRHLDTSDVLGDLAENTGLVLVQYGDLDDGIEWQHGDLQENLERAFDNLGLDLDKNREAIDTLIDESTYVHEGLTLTVANYADVSKFRELSYGAHEGVTITTTDPVLALLDSWNGCVALARVDGVVTTTVNRVQLDSKAPGYGSIDNIIGAYKPGFAADFTVTPTN